MTAEPPPNECAVCGAPVEIEQIDVTCAAWGPQPGKVTYRPGRFSCSENPGHDPRGVIGDSTNEDST